MSLSEIFTGPRDLPNLEHFLLNPTTKDRCRTSRADGHQFSVFAEKVVGERQEACVEIARLDACLAQQAALVRIAASLAVGGLRMAALKASWMR